MKTSAPVPAGRRPARFSLLRRHEGLLLFLVAAILSLQLLISPYIGIADNGDFPKITGRLSLGPTDPDHLYKYFSADYVRSDRYKWKSPLVSTELWPAMLAVYLSGATKEGDSFNIRWARFTPPSFSQCSICSWSPCAPLPVWAAIAAGAAAVWIFTDVLYVAYFNSFYPDAAALLGLMGCVALAGLIVTRGPRISLMVAFSLFAILLLGSNLRHALWGFLPATFLFLSARRQKAFRTSLAGAGAAALLLIFAIVVARMTTAEYRGISLFNLIFYKLAKYSADPLRDLEALGLSREDLPYVGLYVFLPQSPATDPKWFDNFCARSSYSKVVKFYLHEPTRALKALRYDLETNAPYLRFDYANFRRQDATQPQQRTDRFASWSDLRSALFFRWPAHILVWYLLLGSGLVVILRAHPSAVAVQMAWVTWGLIAAAAVEFCVSSLADACETFRHLFLFHVLTDLTVFLALTALLSGTLTASLSRIHGQGASS